MRILPFSVMLVAALGQAALADPVANTQASEVEETLAVMNKPPVPNYPIGALNKNLQGRCIVTFDVNAEGKPENIRPACTDRAFCKQSGRAISKVTFSLSTDETGEPVTAKDVTYPLEYRLGGVRADPETWGEIKACS